MRLHRGLKPKRFQMGGVNSFQPNPNMQSAWGGGPPPAAGGAGASLGALAPGAAPPGAVQGRGPGMSISPQQQAAAQQFMQQRMRGMGGGPGGPVGAGGAPPGAMQQLGSRGVMPTPPSGVPGGVPGAAPGGRGMPPPGMPGGVPGGGMPSAVPPGGAMPPGANNMFGPMQGGPPPGGPPPGGAGMPGGMPGGGPGRPPMPPGGPPPGGAPGGAPGGGGLFAPQQANQQQALQAALQQQGMGQQAALAGMGMAGVGMAKGGSVSEIGYGGKSLPEEGMPDSGGKIKGGNDPSSTATVPGNLKTHPGKGKMAEGGSVDRFNSLRKIGNNLPMQKQSEPLMKAEGDTQGEPEKKAKGGVLRRKPPEHKAKKESKAGPPPVPMYDGPAAGDGGLPPTPSFTGAPGPQGPTAAPPPTPMAKGGECDKMAMGGVAKVRRGFPDTNKAPGRDRKSGRFAKGGGVRGSGAAVRGTNFSGIY